ncbi:hypothetical protein KY285_008488 [Solanum tuberosum]|nr:hypothetical protein KY285_008488 [Solanum tuberosum]
MAEPATGQPPPVTDQNNFADFPPLMHPSLPTRAAPEVVKPYMAKAPTDAASSTNRYANIVKANNIILPSTTSIEPIPIKKIYYNNGIPRVTWTEEEVDRMNTIENLQYAVIGKFSYGWPDLEELRIQIPKQCNVKGDCKIGLLRNRAVKMGWPNPTQPNPNGLES